MPIGNGPLGIEWSHVSVSWAFLFYQNSVVVSEISVYVKVSSATQAMQCAQVPLELLIIIIIISDSNGLQHADQPITVMR